MITSYSEISQMQFCERSYYYKFGLGLRPKDQKNSINVGTIGHEMLAEFYKQLQGGADIDSARESIKKLEYPKELLQDQLKAWIHVNKYIDLIDTNVTIISVEDPYIVEFAPGFSIGIKPDLVLKDSKDTIEIEDYKFILRKWSQNAISRYMQLRLYLVVLREYGLDIKRTRLRLIDTSSLTSEITYKVYEPSDKEVEIIRNELIREMIKIEDLKDRPVADLRNVVSRTLNYWLCKTCPFVFPCNLELEGKDVTQTLANMYEPSDYGYLT